MSEKTLPWAYLIPHQRKVAAACPEIAWHTHQCVKHQLISGAFICIAFPFVFPLVAVHVVAGCISHAASSAAEFIVSLAPVDRRGELVKAAWQILPLAEIQRRLALAKAHQRNPPNE